MFRTYSVTLLSSLVALFSIVGAFNYAVDPYYFFHAPLIPRFNQIKIANERLLKASYVKALAPTAIYLGISRANVGINPYHAAWHGVTPYNLTLNGAALYELERYLEDAATVAPLKTVLLDLD